MGVMLSTPLVMLSPILVMLSAPLVMLSLSKHGGRYAPFDASAPEPVEGSAQAELRVTCLGRVNIQTSVFASVSEAIYLT